jgi:hypothetical protein
MLQLVEFPLQDGSAVLVQVEDAATGPTTRGLGDRTVSERARQTFEEAIGPVQPAAQALVSRLRHLAEPPDEVNVEFGVELHAQAGAFIAAAGTAANFKVSLLWRRPAPPGPAG